MSQILTASRLRAFRTCARLHHYRYLLGRTASYDSLAVRFGTLFHTGMELWWLGWQLSVSDRLEAALGGMRHEAPSLDEEDLVIAEELLTGYHLRWANEPLRTELVEHQFVMPLVNPETGYPSRTYTISGKIDALVLDERDGRKYLVEHKTTTSDIDEGSAYWRRLRMDGQVSTYYSAFPDVAGCIYDVIRRPLLRRHKATPEASRTYTKKGQLYASQRSEDESLDDFRLRVREAILLAPDTYYKRGVVVRLDGEIREHQHDVWQQANTMREMENAKVAPRNPDACIQYNRQCDYFDVCTGAASIDDERLFQITPIHPELEGVT